MEEQNTKTTNHTWPIALSLLFVIFGILLAAQGRTQIGVANSLENQSSEDLGQIILNLTENRDALAMDLEKLENEIHSMEEKTEAGISLQATLDNQLRQLSIFTGATEVSGPGVSVTITGDSSVMYLDLVDIVNELFVSGAEAVAINDTRITFNTVINEQVNAYGELVNAVDGRELLSPIVIKAIGNADTLEKGLTYNGGIINMLNVLYKVYPVVKKEEMVTIPPAAEFEPTLITYQ